MKTIMIVVGGLADLPSVSPSGKSPLMEAETPALDALAKCGCCGLAGVVPEGVEVNPENALLALLGYDFRRGIPNPLNLAEYGACRDFAPSDIRYFVIPKFSGHGVVISDNDMARGIGMMALLRPVFAVDSSTGKQKESPTGSLADKANAAIQAIESFDFVLIYVDSPRMKSLEGDFYGKIEEIEKIDNELIAPVADYVWNAKLQMTLVVTGDTVCSWHQKRDVGGDVPAAVYFNDDLPYETERFDEESVADGPLAAPLPGDLLRLLISFEPSPEEK